MRPKGGDGMANYAHPDQTACSFTVWSGSTACPYLSVRKFRIITGNCSLEKENTSEKQKKCEEKNNNKKKKKKKTARHDSDDHNICRDQDSNLGCRGHNAKY